MDDTLPVLLSNTATQPNRDAQPVPSVDTALGDAFTSSGRSNNIKFVGEFESAFASYLARRGLVTVGDFQEVEAIAYLRNDNSVRPRQSWRQATGFKGWNPKLAEESKFTMV